MIQMPWQHTHSNKGDPDSDTSADSTSNDGWELDCLKMHTSTPVMCLQFTVHTCRCQFSFFSLTCCSETSILNTRDTPLHSHGFLVSGMLLIVVLMALHIVYLKSFTCATKALNSRANLAGGNLNVLRKNNYAPPPPPPFPVSPPMVAT